MATRFSLGAARGAGFGIDVGQQRSRAAAPPIPHGEVGAWVICFDHFCSGGGMVRG